MHLANVLSLIELPRMKTRGSGATSLMFHLLSLAVSWNGGYKYDHLADCVNGPSTIGHLVCLICSTRVSLIARVE